MLLFFLSLFYFDFDKLKPLFSLRIPQEMLIREYKELMFQPTDAS